MMRPTIYVNGGIMYLWYFESTLPMYQKPNIYTFKRISTIVHIRYPLFGGLDTLQLRDF